MSVLVARPAPDFTAPAVLGNGEIVNEFKFHEKIEGKYALLFFYPLDFTFVCPSELIAVQNRLEEFRKRKIEVFGVSVDSHYTHNAWRNTPTEQGGIGKIDYTLIADIQHSIAQAYGVEHPAAGVAFRASFLIDKTKLVRVQLVNDLPIGRDIDEIIRLFDAIQFTEKHGEVCPAGWREGKEGMKADPNGVAKYLSQNAEKL